MAQHHNIAVFLAAACLLLAVQLPTAAARPDKAMIACSPYVSPCHCGLCPRIVDCSKQPTAECFCGTNSPGIYPHPSDPSKFWMCSYDSQSHIPYGVEVPCPGRLVFDPVIKVCTVPAAVSPPPTTAQASTPPPPAAAAPAKSEPQPTNTSGNSSKDGNTNNSSSGSSNKGTATSKVAWVGTNTDRAAAYRTPAAGAQKHSSSNKP